LSTLTLKKKEGYIMKNKLLDMITEEELRNLLFVESLTIKSIAKKYKVDVDTVDRLMKIYGIKLDRTPFYQRVTKEELENLLFIEELSPEAIGRVYNVDRNTIVRAAESFGIDIPQGNKLLRKVTEEELRDLLFNKYMTPAGIGVLYKVDNQTVERAIDILGIELDKEIWYRGSSPKQRELSSKGTKLTDKQHQIIVGNLLGDGSICKSGKSAYFSIAQSRAHKEYIDWLYEELLPFSRAVSEISNTDKNGKEFYGNCLQTISTPEFLEYRNLFYPNDVKIVPKDINNRLTDLSLAVWFMDDGGNDKDARTSCLCTNGFTVEDVEFLIDVLAQKFNVKASLRYMKGKTEKHPMIYMNGIGYDTFHSIVDSLLNNCFSYKAGRSKLLLTENSVREIRKLDSEGASYKELAVKYNVSYDCIRNAVLAYSWKNVI
jgi:hypothetical protein